MSIFISYRRSVSKHLARLIFQELRSRGHDAFLDVSTLDSGAIDRIILNQIAARPHFLLILSPGALERCANEGDWLRREIEEAFRLKRNIVPIFDEGFDIEQEKQFLPEPIRSELPLLNAPPYSHYYFDAFMDTLCNRFLKQPVYDVLVVPTPEAEREEVQRRIVMAAQLDTNEDSRLQAMIFLLSNDLLMFGLGAAGMSISFDNPDYVIARDKVILQELEIEIGRPLSFSSLEEATAVWKEIAAYISLKYSKYGHYYEAGWNLPQALHNRDRMQVDRYAHLIGYPGSLMASAVPGQEIGQVRDFFERALIGQE